jgi:hypothetical protein
MQEREDGAGQDRVRTALITRTMSGGWKVSDVVDYSWWVVAQVVWK